MPAPDPGTLLLTGSATSRGTTHCGAARIVTVRMRPLTLPERGVCDPTVTLADLLTGARNPIGGTTNLTMRDHAHEIVRSGFPGMRALEGRALRTQLDGHLERIVDHDVPEAGHELRRPTTPRAWLTAHAAACSAPVSYEKIRDAATAGHTSKPAKTTTLPYIDVLTNLRILDPLHAWLPSLNHLHRLTKAPKHHLVDPALAVRLLGLDTKALLAGNMGSVSIPRDRVLLGALFESLAAMSVRVFAQHNEATVSHRRTYGGEHEIDLIVETGNGDVVAIDAKLSATINDRDVRHCNWLEAQIADRVLDKVVLNTGPRAYRRADGVAVIPLALLGP